MVLHDHNGVFQVGASVGYESISDPEIAEILACRSGVQLAKERNVPKLHICIELDAKGLVTVLNQAGKNLSANGPLIEDLKERIREFQEAKVSWIHRSANNAAHSLAKEGLCVESRVIWDNAPPDCILQTIASEISEHFI